MNRNVFIKLSSQKIHSFQNVIWNYYKKHGRKLPWRPPALKIQKGDMCDPYKVLVSEVMLQQTQVSRVLQKYSLFLKRFETLHALAAASFHEVISLWSGLGYNRRAKFLHETAKVVVEKYKGKIPQDVATLMMLPGIGKGTAGALSAFAFNKPAVFIETNIRTVFIQRFFKDRIDLQHSHILENVRMLLKRGAHSKKSKKILIHDKDILPLIEQTLDKENSREWYYALMDYGVYLKSTRTNPSRGSVHYKRQSPFKGSKREMRGKILKLLLENKSIPIRKIKKYISGDARHIKDALEELHKENFVHFTAGFVKLVK